MSDDDGAFALSPDGRSLAYTATLDGVTSLFVRALDESAPRRLEGTEGASQPFWSPDSRTLGFFAGLKLKRVDIAGGQPRILASAPAPRGGSWSEDGVILFLPSAVGGIWRVSAFGGVPARVVAPTRVLPSPRWPEFLPDGRRFLFFGAMGARDTHGIYLGSLDGPAPVRVVDAEGSGQFVPPDRLLWVRDRTLVWARLDIARGRLVNEPTPIESDMAIDAMFRGLFSASPTLIVKRTPAPKKRELMWFDRAGTHGMGLGAPEDALANPALSPDGKYVALHRIFEGASGIWLLDTARALAVRGEPAGAPVWSADSRRLAYLASGYGSVLLKMKTVGEDAVSKEVGQFDGSNAELTDWSSDGRFLLYQTLGATTGMDVRVISLGGEPRATGFLTTADDELAAQFSPDGRWVAYESDVTDAVRST